MAGGAVSPRSRHEVTRRVSMDALPAGCALSIEVDAINNRVRFVATNAAGRQSEPSGWFALTDDEICLTWAAFWVTP